VLLSFAIALPACRKSEETVAPTGASPPVTAPAPTAPAPATGTVEPTPVVPTPPPVTATGPSAPRDAGVVLDAGVLLDAGARDAAPADAGGTRTDAGSPSQRAQAYFDRCTVIMQNCFIPTTGDGGLPKLRDPAECRAAAEACRAACQ
jgi:hypothetical protein